MISQMSKNQKNISITSIIASILVIFVVVATQTNMFDSNDIEKEEIIIKDKVTRLENEIQTLYRELYYTQDSIKENIQEIKEEMNRNEDEINHKLDVLQYDIKQILIMLSR